ncbi:hypothetical protein J31TS4_22130 [Paenibacillus sp. J31TS4]|nr:hypothetical protein J31TS4_22130 [Paenibacillus sp. J31TS4]
MTALPAASRLLLIISPVRTLTPPLARIAPSRSRITTTRLGMAGNGKKERTGCPAPPPVFFPSFCGSRFRGRFPPGCAGGRRLYHDRIERPLARDPLPEPVA